MIKRTLKTAFALALGIGALVFGGTAAAQSGTPSAKATFAYSSLVSLPACNTLSGTCGNGDSDWQPILRQQIKMASQKDLFFGASLQCGIVTDTTVKSRDTGTNSYDTAEARGTIRVRIKLVPAGGGTPVYAMPTSGLDATAQQTSGVVFCDRVQTLNAKFAGLNCTADANGVVTCTSPEELQLILKTLNANAFNFVAPNLSSGVYNIEVQARSSVASSTGGSNGSLASANAFIGAGSVSVESVRMVKGNDGSTLSLD
ncbi:hypothetical protein [Ramlibacter sp.]|uniref:hypothetical protein n=1 Tax=Ramlibacter sp. TaxID=1917967 RepID=UPI002FCA2EB7